MHNNQVHLEPDCYYHIYNRAVGDEDLFYSPENYFYFLKKYNEYLSPVIETFCYCLVPNHFHFLIRVKSDEEIMKIIRKEYETDKVKIAPNLYISKQFSNFFNGYSQAINKQQMRRGTLFTRPFKRKKVDSIEYLRNLTVYIHSNPVSHGLVAGLSEWHYSSYRSILFDTNTQIKRGEVVSWFDDIANFSIVHQTSATNGAITIELD